MAMKYGRVAGLDKPVSRILQGSSLQGPPDMLEQAKEDRHMVDLFDQCFELGITTFDTGHVYAGGNSERALGEWMDRRGNRDDVVILTKGAHHNSDRKRVTPYDIASDLYDSLARLRSDYIDLYLLHRDDPSLPVGPIIDTLNEHQSEGRITLFGASNWTHDRIREANEYAESHGLSGFAVSSPNLTLAIESEPPWADCISIAGDTGLTARQWYAEQGMPLFLWSSMAQGFFSGRFTSSTYEQYQDQIPESCDRAYCHADNFERLNRVEELAREKDLTIPQVALAWILCQPLDLYPIVGVFNADECAENLVALNVELTPNEVAWLELKQDDR